MKSLNKLINGSVEDITLRALSNDLFYILKPE
jgi:hypothetical protein